VPVPVPVKVTAVVGEPLQITSSAGGVTTGVGLTVMVNVCGNPVHVTPPPVYWGVTVTVATTAVDVELAAVNEAMSPVPLAASPMEVVLFVHV
jgi:hypothetical protein